ncbi:Retrovirus-related Pol polyprotein from transposon RE1 [Vitis vinifera]|uniref:Retrovirus-related Pol polyprotein from transposon RE1 n=1 Tax=Vitis vinifera TaxID=29760 RepID=A0A438GLF3_VITVI|nr:Retrovirus-related Pol polyprotein from transposon RE1 [Vitis vinifera]
MKKKYQGSTRTKRQQLQALRSEFEMLRMKPGESVSDFFSRTMAIINKISVDRGRGKGRGVRGARDGGRGRGRRGNFRADEDQPDFQNRGRGRNQQFDKSKVECFRCHKFGHYRSECYTKLPNDKEKREKSNYAEKKEVETLLMVVQVNEQPQAEVWYVDTDCSNHMCGSIFFCFLNEGFCSTVSFGDCSTVNVMGKGDINIRTKNGFVETISNVFYVPDLKSNLLSAGQLQEKGYIITIQKGACEIYDPSRGAIVVVQMGSNRLFPLKIESVQSFLMAEVKDLSWLWHFRCGHLNFVCEECVVGKQHRSQFPQGKSRRAKNVLELVHSDIYDPINPTSNGEWCIGEKKRTILNMVRSLLARGKIPKSFWPEAVNWSIHVLNKSPTFFVQNMTLEEAWSGRKPTVDNFKIFGCIAYAHVPDEKMKKLDDKGEKCVFLGRLAWMQDFEVTGVQSDNYDTIAHYALLSDCDPITFQEAIKDLKWHKAMNEEIMSIEKNNSWELVELPKGQKSIGVKWVYKTKLNKDGGVDKYKARLVAKGYKQEFRVDYKEVFAPVAKLDTIHLVLSMVAQNSWFIHQLDMKSAFLHGELEEEVYIEQPLVQSSTGVFSSQKKYALKILDKFMLKDCNSVITPSEVGLKLSKSGAGKRVDSTLYKQIVGSLMYLTSTRPDIMHIVNLIGRYMENPTEVHLLAAKRIFYYLKGTVDFGILYKRGEKSSLIGFSNSDYAITWSSKKQQIVTLSTTEVEFVAAALSSCQVIWLRRLLEVLYNQQQGPTVIYCDNLSAIKLSKNLVLHGRSKHIDVRYYFLRDLCKDGVIDLVFCKSEDQIANILTKPLKPTVFMKLRSMLGVCSSKEVVAASGKALQIDS